MYTGILPKTQQPFYIRQLRPHGWDILASIKLQNAVLSRFDEEQTVIHVHTPREFEERCDGKHAITLGAFIKDQNGRDKLIAQQTLELFPDDRIPLPPKLNISCKELGCVSGFMVHPDYWGNGLTDALLNCLQQVGHQSFDKTGFLSMVDANNPFSYNVLMNRGYAIIDTYIDPVDNGQTYAFLSHPVIQQNRRLEVESLPSGLYKEISCIINHQKEPALITKRKTIRPQQGVLRERAAA